MQPYGNGPLVMGVRIGKDGKQLFSLRHGDWVGERRYADFLRLSHSRKPRQGETSFAVSSDAAPLASREQTTGASQRQGMPKKSLILLSKAAPWKRDGEAWRPELTGSCAKVECWLRGGLSVAPLNSLKAAAVAATHAKPTLPDERLMTTSEKNPTLEFLSDRYSLLSVQSDKQAKRGGSVRGGSSFADSEATVQETAARDLQQYFMTRTNLEALLAAAVNPAGLFDDGGGEDVTEGDQGGGHCRSGAKGEVRQHPARTPCQKRPRLQPPPHSSRRSSRTCGPLRFVVVEPSCGDGRVLQELCDRAATDASSTQSSGCNSCVESSSKSGTKTSSPVPRTVQIASVVGVELDSTMASIARKSLTGKQVPSLSLPFSPSSFPGGGVASGVSVPVVCEDFLATSAERLARALQHDATTTITTPRSCNKASGPDQTHGSSSSSSSIGSLGDVWDSQKPLKPNAGSCQAPVSVPMSSQALKWPPLDRAFGADNDNDRHGRAMEHAAGASEESGNGRTQQAATLEGADSTQRLASRRLEVLVVGSPPYTDYGCSLANHAPLSSSPPPSSSPSATSSSSSTPSETFSVARSSSSFFLERNPEASVVVPPFPSTKRRESTAVSSAVVGHAVTSATLSEEVTAAIAVEMVAMPTAAMESEIPLTSSPLSRTDSDPIPSILSLQAPGGPPSSVLLQPPQHAAPTTPAFRSLPLRFVLHAALPISAGGLGARRVAFLLPPRCAKPSFEAAVRQGLALTPHLPKPRTPLNESTDAQIDGDTSSDYLGVTWKVRCSPSPDKFFHFRGRLIPQPSVIWTLTRKGFWEEENREADDRQMP